MSTALSGHSLSPPLDLPGGREDTGTEAYQLHEPRGTACVQCDQRGGVVLLRQRRVHEGVCVLTPWRRGGGGGGGIRLSARGGHAEAQATLQDPQHFVIHRLDYTCPHTSQ